MKQFFHVMIFLPFAFALFLGFLGEYIEYIGGAILVGLVIWQVMKDKKEKNLKKIQQIKEEISIFQNDISREYEVIKNLSSKGDEYNAELDFYSEAKELGADAIINFRVNNQIVSNTYGSNSLSQELLLGNKETVVRTESEEIFYLSGTAIKYKYSDEEEKIIYTEEQAISDIKNLDVLKENEMVNEEDYLSRKEAIKVKLENYKAFIADKSEKELV